jgi:hypothetical protein
MYQDHFDLNYIRFEKWWLKFRPVVDKPMPVSPSATEYIDIDTNVIMNKEKVDNSWFGEW